MLGTGTRRLLALALVLALIGAGIAAASPETAAPAGRTSAVAGQFLAAFAAPAWSWLLRATAVASALAGGLTLIALVTSARVAGRSRRFEQLAGVNLRQALREVDRRVQSCVALDRPDVVAAFDELLRGAVTVEASDIHLSPTEEGVLVTYRVHGSVYEVTSLPADLNAPLATRVKVLARLDTYVRGKPQDGRLVVPMNGGSVEARVSSLPTERGERVVLRLVRGNRTVPDLEALGFDGPMLQALTELLSRPQGVLFVTGPVGSGKTTTLYASLKHVAQIRGRTATLVTLEDPIELALPFATQTQIHQKSGMSFASVLRSVLRQDPNVLMIGEIRDRETAEIAMQAGLTGHLLLTTVHAESAAGPFARLVDMGIEPFVLASATVGCLSQRLVRVLCTACRRQAAPDPALVERLSRRGVALPEGVYYEPAGCEYCEHTGFSGRIPIGELLVVESALREAVHQRRPTSEIERIAVAGGMPSLIQHGLARAAAGETSLLEVVRVAG